MAQIEIPFSREMAIAAIDGMKITTTRSEKKGEIGDTFWFEDPRRDNEERMVKYGGQFRIIDIHFVGLGTVKSDYFLLEGCASPEEFERVWRSLHRGHFTAKKLYYIHFFARVV